MGRQLVNDTRAFNPHTGLPKHVYHYNTKRDALRGVFQMNGKKYYTSPVYYDGIDVTLEEAAAQVVATMNEKKQELGYDEWISSESYLKKSRKRSQDEWEATHDGKDDWATFDSMENVRISSSGKRVTHIS